MQNDEEAVRVARVVLRKDANFLDMRCALVAFLWAAGQTSAAETEWTTLQNSQSAVLCVIGAASNLQGGVAQRR